MRSIIGCCQPVGLEIFGNLKLCLQTVTFGLFTCLIYVTILYLLCTVGASVDPNSHVEVRAVFIRCEPEERQTLSLDNEVTRFEREELYKHSALHDCSKKIAVTVKIVNEPDMSLDDEYIPIEHVLQGSRRTRLLDPYVMRLRRELPLQAYKLKKIDTVNGVLAYADDSILRFQRSSEIAATKPNMEFMNSSYSSHHNLDRTAHTTKVENYGFSHESLEAKICSRKRDKRYEHNVMIEGTNDDKIPQFNLDQHDVQRKRKDVTGSDTFREPNTDNDRYAEKENHSDNSHKDIFIESNSVNPRKQPSISRDVSTRSKDDVYRLHSNPHHRNTHNLERQKDEQSRTKKHYRNMKKSKSEQQYIVYEIDNPDIWSTVQIQLFEKLSTPEGKTVWNDLSKGEPASVSSLSPEWSDQDLNVRYRAEWIPRQNYTLPITHMCLLTPYDRYDNRDPDEEKFNSLKYGDYIVVPKEDIVTLDDTKTEVKKHLENYSDIEPANQYRRVMVRMSRALMDSKADKMSVESHRGDQYLTIPYERPHQAQIDLEARADENQLVNVGSSGRIMTVVSDNTRRTRTVMNVQIMNTGLTAAHFSIKPRDCGPNLQNYEDDSADKGNNDLMLLPPKHTRNVRLVLPNEIPSDSFRCSIALVSADGDSVAVRDVTIKRGDRCFCVWHCECVCLGEDPKLLCEEMPDTRQVAAGLSLRERSRHARSVCYHDAPSVNIIVTIFGVLLVLLFLGLLKAIFGVVCRCIGEWGLDRIIQMPRQLCRYYESSLQNCSVVYDDEGWPIHPVTKKRTVRQVTRSMEFLLNLVFFIVLPCRLMYDIVKQIYNCVRKPNPAACERNNQFKNTQYDTDGPSGGSQELQPSKMRLRRRRRRRRNRLRKWMTTEAEELSTFLWQKSLLVERTPVKKNMKPVIIDDNNSNDMKKLKADSANSDEDDTEFVLTQMQKSRESLAKSQKSQVGTAVASTEPPPPTPTQRPRTNSNNNRR